MPSDPVPSDRVPSEPVPSVSSLLAEQSSEDTDAGWGEYPETSDDQLYRDRPPHWDHF
jgi:hypothetical protein